MSTFILKKLGEKRRWRGGGGGKEWKGRERKKKGNRREGKGREREVKENYHQIYKAHAGHPYQEQVIGQRCQGSELLVLLLFFLSVLWQRL
jgi:hypothetical protein